MKTREEILNEVLALKNNHIALSMGTGIGKSKVALEKAKSLRRDDRIIWVLIVVPMNNLKLDWSKEIDKWDAVDNINYVFTTYKSLDKHLFENFDMIIFDEGHHITARVLDVIKHLHFSRSMILSATLKPVLINQLRLYMPDLTVYRVKTQEAIDNNILPDPKIILYPLKFNCKDKTELIIKNPKATKYKMIGEFTKRNLYKEKNTRYEIPCTESQYNLELDTQVDWYKRKAMGGNVALKNLWLHKAGERLKWLASKKSSYTKELLTKLQKERTITFCASIEQTELLGQHCIHSKNKESEDIKNSFNNGKIDHITAVAMLDEGVNLTNCRIGIFANINSSDRIQTQRIGRILRHSSPIIILMYFIGSREEEIVNKMIEGYNKDLIVKINNLNEIDQWI